MGKTNRNRIIIEMPDGRFRTFPLFEICLALDDGMVGVDDKSVFNWKTIYSN